MEIQQDPDGYDRLFIAAPEYDARFEVWGNCPVQALGTVFGRHLYFHARHDGWSFDVADHAGNLPSDGFQNSDGFYREGDYYNAGCMPHQEAITFIERCLREYTSGRLEAR